MEAVVGVEMVQRRVLVVTFHRLLSALRARLRWPAGTLRGRACCCNTGGVSELLYTVKEVGFTQMQQLMVLAWQRKSGELDSLGRLLLSGHNI